ncbi:MAG: LicD family protein [Lachnospiraceae bacterium]|nr:LicD family protein [Lachnospiraceae bacterium]
MTELQKKILEIMKVFDRVCRENDLRYYMLGGTMLGAVRHKGFIPWDDDADFGLPRRDYEQLLTFKDEQLPEGYQLRHFSKESGVPYAFIRLEDIRTTCIETRRSGSGYVGGVYIDIFPLDADGNVLPLRIVKEYRVSFLKRLLYAHIAEPGAVKNPVKRAVMSIVKKRTDMEALVRKLDATVKRYGVAKENLPQWGEARFSNYLGHWGRKESVPRRVFDGEIRQRKYFAFDFRRGEKISAAPGGRRKEYEFEGHRFFGPVDSAGYLTALYGYDYMMPPKEEERCGHPAIIELEQSYLDVIERKNADKR